MSKPIEDYFNAFPKNLIEHLKSRKDKFEPINKSLGSKFYSTVRIEEESNSVEGAISLIIEITYENNQLTKVDTTFEISLSTFNSLGLGDNDCLRLNFVNISLNQGIYNHHLQITSKEPKKRVKINVSDCTIISLGLQGRFDEIELQENHLNKIDVRGDISRLEIFENKGFEEDKNPSGIRIQSDSIESLEFIQNRHYKNVILIATSLQESEFTANQIDNLTYKNGKIGSFKFNNNGYKRIELDNLSPISKEESSLIMFEMNYWNGKVVLRNLNFSNIDYTIKNFRVVAKPEMELILNDNNFESVKLKDIHWDYRSINSQTKYKGSPKKDAILLLKTSYSSQSDGYYQRVFESFEKRWYHDKGSDLPLFLSWHSNAFGLSILKPFIWLISFILLEILLLIVFKNDCAHLLTDNYGKFIYLLNPAHRTSEFLDLIKGTTCDSNDFRNWILIIDNVFRIIIVYSLFQFINAFRYRYNLK